VKRILILLIAVLASFASLTTAQDLSDVELLAALDDARFFDDTVTQLTIRIVSETPDETRQAELALSFFDNDAGAYARIEFTTPEELAGQIFLSTPNGTYFYGPDLDFPIKTSATTEVFGDAAVAQTSGIRFAESYTIGERRTSTNEAGAELWEIDLVAMNYSVAFQAITVIVDAVNLRPISAMLYAVSGLPFYEVLYETYESRDDDVYVTTQRIVNQLLLGRITTSQILAIDTAVLSFELFDPNSLGASQAP